MHDRELTLTKNLLMIPIFLVEYLIQKLHFLEDKQEKHLVYTLFDNLNRAANLIEREFAEQEPSYANQVSDCRSCNNFISLDDDLIEELKLRLQNLTEIRDILMKRFKDADDKEDKISQKSFISRLNTCLESIYADREVTIPQVAKRIAMSERQFYRRLKSIMDMSPVEYLRYYRLEKGKQLLMEGRSACYAAIEAGFSSQSYFGRCFKDQFGVSPNDYKKSLNGYFSENVKNTI